MNTTSRAFVFVLALAFLSCGTAASSEMEHTKSFAISGFGSYQAYDMSDVNRAMHGALTSFSGARADKDELRGAAGFGGGIRIWPSDRAFLSLEYQRLPASNSGSGQYAGSTYTVDRIDRKALTLYFDPIKTWNAMRHGPRV